MKIVTSLQNSIIKNILKLQEKSRERKKQGLFIIEGKREITLAINAGYCIENILFVDSLIAFSELKKITKKDTKLLQITKEVYQKIAYRNSTEGVIAIAKTKNNNLHAVELTDKNPLVLVLEAIEKPGNIGAMLRTADAANIDLVCIADAKSDLYNPNIIRSSVGCVFTNKIVLGSSEEIISFLKDKNISIYAATLQNSNHYHEEDYKKSSAIVVGTEATGLSEIWRENANQNINIPMQGQIDSMNVSVAAAIILFEAKRQRNFKNH